MGGALALTFFKRIQKAWRSHYPSLLVLPLWPETHQKKSHIVKNASSHLEWLFGWICKQLRWWRVRLEGLLKFGMSKSHHITIRQQISLALLGRETNKWCNFGKMAFGKCLVYTSFLGIDKFKMHGWLFSATSHEKILQLLARATPSIYCLYALPATLLSFSIWIDISNGFPTPTRLKRNL